MSRIAKINLVRDKLHQFYKDIKTEEQMSELANESHEASGILDEPLQEEV
jgi:hypothetical protein